MLYFLFQVALKLYNNKDYVDLSDYWKSGTWDIIEVPAFLNIYNESKPTETDITFYITIRRKTLFYTVNLILPTVLISFLCVLVFYLPAEAGEKVSILTLLIKSKSMDINGYRIQINNILMHTLTGYTWYQHSPVTRCVSSAGIENPAANFSCAATYRQIPALYVHYEHRLHPGYSCYY